MLAMASAENSSHRRDPGSPQAHPRPLLSFFATYRKHPGLLLLTVTLAVLANASIPFTQHLVGMAFGALAEGEAVRVDASGQLDRSGAWWWVGILLAFALVRGALAWLATVAAFALAHRLLHYLRLQVFTRVQELDLDWHQQHGAGEVIARTTRDGDKVRDAIIHGSRMVLETALFLIGVMIFMLWYHWSLALMTGISLCLATGLMWLQAPLLVRLDRHAGDRYDRLTQDLGEGVAGVRVIKAFRLERKRVDHFRRLVELFAGASRRAQRESEWRLQLPQLIVALNHAAAAFVVTYLVAVGTLPIGHLTAVVMMLLSVVFRIEGLARGFALFYEARASAARLREVMDAEPAIVSGAQPLPAGPLGLRLQDVHLQRGGQTILAGLDLELKAGEMLALVGATGSGKSSLIALLPRLSRAQGGTISIVDEGGQALESAQARLDALRQAVHLVPQEAFLFSNSIAENLRFAAPEASEDELWQALRAAAAEDMVRALDEGLDTRIGERGTTLSGGQKQRLALARALLARPRILILDDATSALDTATESQIFAELRQASGGCSVLLGAARPSTVRRADRVAWLEDGRIRAIGSHADLAARYPGYRSLLGLDAEAAA